jgi:catalase
MHGIKQVIGTVAEQAALLTEDSKTRNMAPFVEDSKGGYITTNHGCCVDDTDNSLKAGIRGPIAFDDFHVREKLTHFDHERIPERVVHARGTGAHGYFVLDKSLKEYTKAKIFNDVGKKTPVFVRFSTVLGSKGSPDTVRDVRGFAIKFYTEEGNFDLVGNNIPVFFIQDAIKFPDIIHSGKPEPHNEIPQASTAHNNFWDFIGLSTETAHMIMWALSDRAIPRSFRMMQGFGIHTFVFSNEVGQRCFVKFHFKPTLGTHSLVWDEAVKLQGVDSDFHRRDLTDAINDGYYPEWELCVQIVPAEDENKFDFDLLDPTKIIPEELVPLIPVGKLVLNRNVDNFFAETEQVAFCTSHLVPGIEASHDPLLQGRLHSYLDTQISRLGGPNFQEIPINRPVCPVRNNQRDGMHRQTIAKGEVNYFPNRFGCPAIASAKQAYHHSPINVEGVKIRAKGPKFGEHFSQARLFYNSLSSWEQEHLKEAAVFELGHVDDQGVRERVIDMFNHIDSVLAIHVASKIGVEPPKEFKGQAHNNRSPALSQANTPKKSIQSRKIAFLVAPGFNGKQLAMLTKLLKSEKAEGVLVGPVKGKVKSADGKDKVCKWSFDMTKSVQYDGVAIVGGSHVSQLEKNGTVLAFINEAFKHCKPVIAMDEGAELIGMLAWPGIAVAKESDKNAVTSQGVVTVRNPNDDTAKKFGHAVFDAILAHRHWERSIEKIPA